MSLPLAIILGWISTTRYPGSHVGTVTLNFPIEFIDCQWKEVDTYIKWSGSPSTGS